MARKVLATAIGVAMLIGATSLTAAAATKAIKACGSQRKAGLFAPKNCGKGVFVGAPTGGPVWFGVKGARSVYAGNKVVLFAKAPAWDHFKRMTVEVFNAKGRARWRWRPRNIVIRPWKFWWRAPSTGERTGVIQAMAAAE